MKRWIADFLYVFLIVSIILFMIFGYRFMQGKGKECLENPLEFMESMNEGSSCNCINQNVILQNAKRQEIKREVAPFNLSLIKNG